MINLDMFYGLFKKDKKKKKPDYRKKTASMSSWKTSVPKKWWKPTNETTKVWTNRTPKG